MTELYETYLADWGWTNCLMYLGLCGLAVYISARIVDPYE